MEKMLFVWIALYGLCDILADLLSAPLWSGGILLGYVLAFLLWIFRTGRQKTAGLRKIPWDFEEFLRLLPLGVLPVCNLLTGTIPFPGVAFLLQMLCVAFIEEVFFRGFLLSSLQKREIVGRIVLTSLIFALLHGIHFFENGEPVYTWLQIFSSFFASLCYCAVTIRTGSILPCVITHFLTNITATGSVGTGWALWGLVGSSIVYALWSQMLMADLKKR